MLMQIDIGCLSYCWIHYILGQMHIPFWQKVEVELGEAYSEFWTLGVYQLVSHQKGHHESIPLL